jgi:hypothetical protein
MLAAASYYIYTQLTSCVWFTLTVEVCSVCLFFLVLPLVGQINPPKFTLSLLNKNSGLNNSLVCSVF